MEKDMGAPSFQAALTQSWVSPFSSRCRPSPARGCGGSEDDRPQLLIPWDGQISPGWEVGRAER